MIPAQALHHGKLQQNCLMTGGLWSLALTQLTCGLSTMWENLAAITIRCGFAMGARLLRNGVLVSTCIALWNMKDVSMQ